MVPTSLLAGTGCLELYMRTSEWPGWERGERPHEIQKKGKGCQEGASPGWPPRTARALPSRRPRLCQKPAFLEGGGESVNEKLGAERAGEGPLPGTLGHGWRRARRSGSLAPRFVSLSVSLGGS